MKKSYIFIVLFLLFIIFFTIIGTSFVNGNIHICEENDILDVQSNKEVYFSGYGYDINNPNVIINPYGNSPLTALVMFTSSHYSEVEITIKSKDGYSDINYTFDKEKYHMIPIYGLYANYDNTVIIKCENIEKVLNIKTENLPDDFTYVDDMYNDNFIFYNSNYPYIIDNNYEVRWYLDSNYYGNITMLDNSNFIIGSDRYNEYGNAISIYKMNFLGKIYNEYVVNNYYGYNALYNDNILVLSDNVLLLDIQTGEVIFNYGKNDKYNYLDIYEENIVLGKDDNFYILDNEMEEINYNKKNNKITFYNRTSNYNILSSNRFGNLEETIVSNEKISLIGYDKLDKIVNISINKEIDRIKIVNNNDSNIYVIFDKFMDKRVYEVSKLKYINLNGLGGKYTIYFKINDRLYITDYFVEA